MIQEEWLEFFSDSSFVCFKKSEVKQFQELNLLNQLVLPAEVSLYHLDRQHEFKLGRLCACLAHRDFFNNDLLNLPSNKDRSPSWPKGVIGSISHSKTWVGAAVSSDSKLLGVGIDFEELGRTKLELSPHIRAKEDIQKKSEYTDEELLSLIFSFKESLYKALYPQVKVFFGFHDAYISEIDSSNGTFQIKLKKDLNQQFKVGENDSFRGKYSIHSGQCLSVIEIKNEKI